jgi:hypothetical protein
LAIRFAVEKEVRTRQIADMNQSTEPIRWRRVFLEGAVIVGSILLAFGIDAWWDGLQDRRLERQYYVRVAADLTDDSASIERIMRFNQVYRQSALALIEVAEGRGGSAHDHSELMHMVAWAGYLTRMNLETATFDDLVGSGRLGLLTAPELTSALLLYYRVLPQRMAAFDRAPQEFSGRARRWLPAGFTAAAQDCLWDEILRGELRCRVEIDEQSAERVLALLSADPEVAGHLREVVWFVDHIEGLFQSQRAMNSWLRQALREHLHD